MAARSDFQNQCFCCSCGCRDEREAGTPTGTPTPDTHVTELERLVGLRRDLADTRHSCTMGLAKLERRVELAEEALLNHIKKGAAAANDTCRGYHDQTSAAATASPMAHAAVPPPPPPPPQTQQPTDQQQHRLTVVGNVTLSNGQLLAELKDETGLVSYRLLGCSTADFKAAKKAM